MAIVAHALPFVIGVDTHARRVIECIATYGARLARAVNDAGYEVAEAARMDARANRGVGKSDPLDARRIAAAVLPLEATQLRRPRADDGVRAALRVLTTAREQMSTERTSCVNALTALLRSADLGIDARKPLTNAHIRSPAGAPATKSSPSRSHELRLSGWPSASASSMKSSRATRPSSRC